MSTNNTHVEVWLMDAYSFFAGYSLAEIIEYRLSTETGKIADIIDGRYLAQLEDHLLDLFIVGDITFRQIVEQAVAEGNIPCIVAGTEEEPDVP